MSNTINDNSLASIKAQIVNTLLAVVSCFALLQITILLIRVQSFNDPALYLRLSIQVYLPCIFLLRHKLSTGYKGWSLVVCGFLAGASSLVSFGFAAGGTLTLFATVVVAALIISFKAGAGILLLSSLLMFYSLYLANIGELEFANSADEYSVSAVGWLTQTVIFVYISAIVLFAFRRFFQLLVHANQQLSQHSQDQTKQAQHADTLLKAAIDAVPYRIFWKDLDLTFRGANPAFTRDAEFNDAKELIGKSDFDMAWSKHAYAYRADDTEVINSRKPKLNIELAQTNSRGETTYLLSNKVPLLDEEGQVVGVLGAYDDITDRKLMELDLAHAKEMADSASKAKSEFLANMSHEIRTPLNGINGLINLCIEANANEELNDYLKKAKSSVVSLRTIINDILDISKIEANKLVLEHIPFKPHELTEQLLAFVEPLVAEKGISFEQTLRFDPQLTLLGDPTRFLQVLINLCSNAVKFTTKGKVQLEIEWEQRAKRLNFSVKDTGIGIAEETLPKLFDSFSQADTSTTRNFGGTGLGLAIVKKLVSLMQGEIHARSELQVGSEFFGFIRAEEFTEVLSNDVDAKYEDKTLSGLSILLVEDNQVNRLIAQKTLSSESAKVTVAVDGVEALEKVRAERFDVVLMDIQMPNMDGTEAIQHIRAERQLDELPVIALTANVLSHEIAAYQHMGFDGHVPKPFEKQELKSVIFAAMENKKRRR